MFSLASLSVLGVVALGPQVVLGSFKFNLSPVVQCAPVNITFSGSDSNNHSVPTTLTILPLLDNVAPIQIPIPNGASNSTGIELNFIPLAAGSRFIASLDDINGPAARVSDVIKVTNDTTGAEINSSCFGSSKPSVNFYQFDDQLSQCEPFTVTYTTANAPNITAFNPRGPSFTVPQSTVSTAPKTASYIMNGVRDFSVVLLFDDGEGHIQTTKLITISGDNTSSKSCFKGSSGNSNNNKKKKTSSAGGLPQSTIIGIAVGAAAIGLLAILLLIYMLRARRRNRTAKDMEFDPALLNRKWPPEEKKIEILETPAVIAAPTSPFSAGEGFVRDPIYTNERYSSSTMSSADARTSISSWNQFIPADQRRGQGDAPQRGGSISESRLSMNTVDVQDILQMATVHQDPSSGPTYQGRAQPSTAGTAMTTFDVAKPAIARLVSTRRSDRASDPPDLPAPVSRNNSASAAAIAAIPAGYGPSSYVFYGDDEDASRTPRQSDGGIGGFPVPAFKQAGNPRDTSESWGNVVER